MIRSVVFALVLGFAGSARAGADLPVLTSDISVSNGIELLGGFPCQVTWFPAPASPSFGAFGRLYFEMWSGPSCTGTFRRSFSACSTGATYPGCATFGSYPLREAQMAALFDRLVEAARVGQKVQVSGAIYPDLDTFRYLGWVTFQYPC